MDYSKCSGFSKIFMLYTESHATRSSNSYCGETRLHVLYRAWQIRTQLKSAVVSCTCTSTWSSSYVQGILSLFHFKLSTLTRSNYSILLLITQVEIDQINVNWYLYLDINQLR